MKIYAKQVPPEYTDSTWIIDNDFYKENIVLIKNRDFSEYGNHMDAYKRAQDNCIYAGWEKVKLLFQLYTGKVWKRTTIRGYIQGEWLA